MTNPKLRVKIYGVRGSYPPTNGNTTHYGVNTTCLRIDIGKNLVIFDAGTGIIPLGNELFSEIRNDKNNSHLWKMHFFFTHSHIDHLMGFPYFLMNYMPQSQMHFFSPRFVNYTLEEILTFLLNPALFPVTLSEMPAERHFYEIGENKVVFFKENSFQLVPVTEAQSVKNYVGKISCLRNYTHPKGGVYIYKIESASGNSLIFATDIEGFINGDQRLINFARDARVLIHDAQYSLSEYKRFQGFGHSTYEMACQVAKAANVEKLILFHHDPNHSDEQLSELENAAKKIFPSTFMATEEMEFILD